MEKLWTGNCKYPKAIMSSERKKGPALHKYAIYINMPYKFLPSSFR